MSTSMQLSIMKQYSRKLELLLFHLLLVNWLLYFSRLLE